MAPIGEMQRGAQKNTKKRNIKKPVRTRRHLTHDYGNPIAVCLLRESPCFAGGLPEHEHCSGNTIRSRQRLLCGETSTVPEQQFFVFFVGVQKAISVRSFAPQLNLTNNPDRSSLVQLYLGSFMWIDPRVLLFLFQSRTKE